MYCWPAECNRREKSDFHSDDAEVLKKPELPKMSYFFQRPMKNLEGKWPHGERRRNVSRF